MVEDYGSARQVPDEDLRYCAVPRRPDPVIQEGLDFDRANAIVLGRAMWANGTVIHYHFFDRDSDGATVRFADSGEDRNALLTAKLFQGRRYAVRLRMYFSWQSGTTAIMYW